MGAAVNIEQMQDSHFCSARLEQVFNSCFERSENTCLAGGAGEPLYQPSQAAGQAHIIYYRDDFFASALHEIAHWCIAGPERRKQLDFGYWYAPEGRNPQQQQAFEAVEVKPQALEWFFSQACAYRFRVSVDNLDPQTGLLPDTLHFRQSVAQQALAWQRDGLPARAGQFFHALVREFDTGAELSALHFCAELID